MGSVIHAPATYMYMSETPHAKGKRVRAEVEADMAEFVKRHKVEHDSSSAG